MKVKLANILCKECLQKWNDVQQAEAAVKKLKKHKNADAAAKRSWKKIIARGMRANPTHHEALMKDALLSVGFFFEQQKQIGPYIADFYIPPHLIVEVDGKIHEHHKAYDAQRDAYMVREGYKVLRVTNAEVVAGFENVLDRISEELGCGR